ncbi:MAG: FprA family A-type flavoprotein [Candidatus Brockarchaeota archaeon]|nr:FprA family A-type flavoprotein [Candidatus Brockarchaeota archaeon]
MQNIKTRKITEDVTLITTLDKSTKKFEEIWEISSGINYNAYLVKDKNSYMLIDSTKNKFSEEFIETIRNIVKDNELKYIAVLHTEPDHSGTIRKLKEKFPKSKIISTRTASSFLKSMFSIETEVVKDGEEIKIDEKEVKVIELPWIHWPDTMMLFLKDERILFSSDAFGAFGARELVFDDEVKFEEYLKDVKSYFASVVSKYRQMILKDLEKINQLLDNVSVVAPAHGLVLKSRIKEIIRNYESWSKLESKKKITILYGSMYGITEEFVSEIKRYLEEKVNEVKVCNVAREELGSILSEVMDSYGIIIISPTYEGNLFPPMSYVLDLLSIKKLGNGKIVCAVATKLWGGVAPKQIQEKLSECGFSLLDKVYEFSNYPTKENLNLFLETVKKLVDIGK